MTICNMVYLVYANMMSLKVMRDMERSREEIVASERRKEARATYYERENHRMLVPDYATYGGRSHSLYMT